jgi:hypothetical protein
MARKPFEQRQPVAVTTLSAINAHDKQSVEQSGDGTGKMIFE